MMNPEVLVIGAGPAGYVAAIRLAQLGKKVLLVDQSELGGVCLNRGCIPTKTLLYYTGIIHKANTISRIGIKFNQPEIDFNILNQHVQNIIVRIRKGIEFLLRSNGIQFLQARASFLNSSSVTIEVPDQVKENLTPDFTIIATGSRHTVLPDIKPDSENIITSDEALRINDVPKTFTIIGAGAVGLEFATIYNRLGSKVSIIELMPQILPGIDIEVANHLMQILKKQSIDFFLNAKITKINRNEKLQISILINDKEQVISADKILLSIGRIPNTDNIGLEDTGIKLTKSKFISVNEYFETSQKNIYAIGDIIGPPLLAHKAMAQGIFVAEKIGGKTDIAPPNYVPNCIYTNPELATVGITENDAKSANKDTIIAKVPLSAIGRAHAIQQTDGFVKLIVDKKTEKILGAQILAPDASNLINEITLAITANIKINDIVNTIHPHPTLSEAISETAAAILKKAIHIINK